MNKEDLKKILDILEEDYFGQFCGLDFKSPFELLIATILSAQCTDKRVNIITEDLFKEYNTPDKIASLSEEEFGKMIKSCGLYRTKSKNIINTCKTLIRDYHGQVPNKMEDLLKLNGVGRKTANVVLSNAFGVPAIAVDTHVFRVSNRLGIAKGNSPLIVEKELNKVIPYEKLGDFHHYLIWHGRNVCHARKPECEICRLAPYCENNML